MRDRSSPACCLRALSPRSWRAVEPVAARRGSSVPSMDRAVPSCGCRRQQAQQRAAAARRGVSVQIASGLELAAWAPDGLVIDPVALDFDDRGALYATSTSRNNMPLDIRAHPSWVPLVHSLRTVDDLLAFYRRELAPERSAENSWLPDTQQRRVARLARSRADERAPLSHRRYQRRRHRRSVARS